MSTTGTYGFVPEIAECFEEAFERAGMNPAVAGQTHLTSAMRSLKFMLNSEWNTIGIRQWMIVQQIQNTTIGMTTFPLGPGGIDILDAVLRRNAIDTPMNRITRQEYLDIATKTLQGRPDRYWSDRQSSVVNVILWRAGMNTSDQIVYNMFRQIQNPGAMANTLDMPTHVLEAFIAGLAMRFAQKWAPEKYDGLRIDYGGPEYPNEIGGKLAMARDEDRERGDVIMSISYSPRYGR